MNFNLKLEKLNKKNFERKHFGKILNYPVRYYARKSGAPNISRWVDGLKLLKVCWIYMISDI